MAAMRIVSLLPSATEILFALGLDQQVVGVSHECDFPPAARSKTVVIHSRIPKDASPSEIDRLVREFSAHGESVYSVDAEALRRILRQYWQISNRNLKYCRSIRLISATSGATFCWSANKPSTPMPPRS